jgi:microcystin-dependent protein
MRIRIDVDLEVPRWVRKGLLFSVSAALLLSVGLGVKAWAGPISLEPFVDGEVLTADKLNTRFHTLQEAVNQSAPPGTVVAFAGASIPAGWLACDGSAVSRSTYASLFSAIGIVHGGGDGTATFNLPDYRGRFLRGVDAAAGRDPDASTRRAPKTGDATVSGGVGNKGNLVGSVEDAAFASHGHGVSDPGHTHGTNESFTVAQGMGGGTSGIPGNTPVWGSYSPAHWFLINSASTGLTVSTSGGSETRPQNAFVNFIIKY